jgi:hypothetical protein
LVFSSDESGDDMILRRTLEGAEKCALRDLRRLLDTEVEYFIVPHYEKGRPRVRCRLKAFRATQEENTGALVFLAKTPLFAVFDFPSSFPVFCDYCDWCHFRLEKHDASGILESD